MTRPFSILPACASADEVEACHAGQLHRLTVGQGGNGQSCKEKDQDQWNH